MTTEQDPNSNYDVHSIDFLNNPSLAGLTEDFKDMGVVQASKEGFRSRRTLLVEHDYALMMLQARNDLEGVVRTAPTAVRWVRLGWPEEWGTPGLDPTWVPIYPAGDPA